MRRLDFLKLLIPLVLVLKGITVHCSSLLGIDLGNEFIKVSILSPGTNFNILINNQSKRKITNAISFANKFRSYDEEANTISEKQPNSTLLNSNDYLGYNLFDRLKKKEELNLNIENYSDNEEFSDNIDNYEFEVNESSKYFSHTYKIDRRRGTINIELKKDVELSSEEITANILNYIKKLAYNHLNIDYKKNKRVNVILGCVIAVPCNYGQRKKQALYHASKIAGFELLGIVHGVSAAALHNIFDLSLNTSKLTMYVDVGSSNINVGIGTISYTEKDNKPVRNVKMYACETLENSSGRRIDIILAEHLRKRYEEKYNVSISKDKKALRRLFIAANKAKLLLSAKKKTEVFVESLYNNKSLVDSISRDEFEQLIADTIKKIEIPINNALKKASLSLKDIEAVELIGSAWRVPRVLNEITNFFNPLQVGMHLNSDEAITMGAVYFAAANSVNFRVREVHFQDVVGSDYHISIQNEESEEKENHDHKEIQAEENKENQSQLRELIMYNSKYPVHKSVILSYRDDLKFALYENEKVISRYVLENLDDATVKKFGHLNPPKINLKFRMDRFGIISLEKSSAYYEEEKEIPVKEKKEDNKKEEKKSEEEKKEGEKKEEEKKEGEKKEEEKKEGEKKEEEKKNEEEKKEEEKKEVKKTEIIKHNIPLKSNLTYIKPLPLTNEEIKQKTENLKNMDNHDIDIFLKSEAKNTLESYIYESRSKLKLDTFKQVSKEDVRSDYLKKLEDYEDWLYIENEEPLENVTQKLQELKNIYEPIKERAYELEIREKVIEQSNKKIKEMGERLIDIADKKPWVIDTMKIVRESLDKEIEWWNKVQEEQKKLDNYSSPAFKASHIESKLKSINLLIDTLDKMKKPVEKVKTEKNKNEEKKEEKKEETGKSKDEKIEENEKDKEENKENPKEGNKENPKEDTKENESDKNTVNEEAQKDEL